MNNKLTKGQIINELMWRLPIVSPEFDDSERLLNFLDTGSLIKEPTQDELDFINDCHID